MSKFTSFDEEKFYQAIQNKDYLTLKINTVSTMLNDPTFARGETEEILKTLEREIPEIFEAYTPLDFEERLDEPDWDKRYFTKLTYWFQENFAKERIDYIKKVGRKVHQDTAAQYAASMRMQNTPPSPTPKTGGKQAPSAHAPKTGNAGRQTARGAQGNPPPSPKPRRQSPTGSRQENQEEKNRNFRTAGAILAVGALVIGGALLISFLLK